MVLSTNTNKKNCLVTLNGEDVCFPHLVDHKRLCIPHVAVDPLLHCSGCLLSSYHVTVCRLYELVSARGDSGENGDEGSLEEGVARGEEARVDCLSALVPVLSVTPTLQHMAQSGQLAPYPLKIVQRLKKTIPYFCGYNFCVTVTHTHTYIRNCIKKLLLLMYMYQDYV